MSPDGTGLLLRGVGLGNWLLPEGYIWGFGDHAASPRQIEALIDTLVGPVLGARFWREFRARFISEDDIQQIAAAGFDHVRLPINWRILMAPDGAWREDGFSHVADLVGWCRGHGLLVLLDLHGAPGGQTGTNIDDSLGRPELFMDGRNVELTVALWAELARRFHDEPAILGYDLLNEPLPNEWQHEYPDDLVEIYRKITAAIRAEDRDHLIMYEGTHWATNWEIFTEVWDSNSVLQFHKYWSPTDRPAIQGYLEVGARLGLPIYMGEGGENTPAWVAAAHQLYEDHEIGWNFWPWKKIETVTSPLSVRAPEGWERIVAFAAGEGGQPTASDAAAILDALLANLPAAACERRDGLVHAMFRRAPVTMPAYAFSFHGSGRSFGTTGARPHTQLRPDDAVSLRRRDTQPEISFEYPPADGPGGEIVADLAPGDWIVFEVDVPAGQWTVTIYADMAQAPPVLTADDVPVALAQVESHALAWTAPMHQDVDGLVRLRVAATARYTLASVAVEQASGGRGANALTELR